MEREQPVRSPRQFRDGLTVMILKAAVLAVALTGVAYAATRIVLVWTGVGI